MKSWYKSSYRRMMMDMHIEDWNDEFLSKLDADDFYNYIKESSVNSFLFKMQSHVGLCYYPTKSGEMHRAFRGREDLMKRLMDKCRANGISVVGYYSLIFNTREEDKHPEWRLVVDRKEKRSYRQIGNGKITRYGKCCPNNAKYREFLKTQIKEIADYFTLDGIFFDMTYWPAVCYCDACRRRFEAETGIAELPDMQDLSAPNAMRFLKVRHAWIAEFCEWITNYTKAVMPNITISHNNACALNSDWLSAVSEEVTKHSDYCAGDLYGDLRKQSFCMKYYGETTPNMPYEYMFSRVMTSLSYHTMNKPKTLLETEIFTNVAHHGANFVIDAINPDGTLDHRVAKTVGEIYKKQIPYEPYMRGKHVGDVGVWYSTSGRYNTAGQNLHSRICSLCLGSTLAEHHVPYRVIANSTTGTMSQYRVVMASAIAGIEEKHRQDVYEYVKGGGTFYFSGVEDTALLKEFFDIELSGYTDWDNTYLAPVKGEEARFFDFDEHTPLAMLFKHPLVSAPKDGVRVLAHLKLPYSTPDDHFHFSSIHSNPPGVLTEYPSVLETRYGKGRVIWSALPFEGMEGYHYGKVIMSLLRAYLPEDEQTVIAQAPAQVEVVTFADTDGLLISTVDLGANEDRMQMPAFPISVRTAQRPRRVCLLPEKVDVDFTYENGRVQFDTRPLSVFDMYLVEY